MPRSAPESRRHLHRCRALAGLLALVACAPAERGSMNHEIVVDGSGRILSWVQPQEAAYDDVVQRATAWLLDGVPTAPNGEKAYYSYSTLSADGRQGLEWQYNPAGLYAMMVDYALAWHAYTGDRRLPGVVQGLLDHHLAHGTTPDGYDWAGVPYATGAPGSLEPSGYGPGDAPGVIQPDKVGELGLGYLKWFLFTGDTTYRDAAIRCADALAAHVRTGDAVRSPWPFRVMALDGTVVEEYSSAVIASVRLFEELVRLGLGQVAAYQAARDTAWTWLMAYPMQNGRWSGYFEDIRAFEAPDNFNQYSAMETARYLLEHPESDPDWATHVPALIGWVEATLIHVEVPNQPGVQWGANVVSEQLADMDRMASHTARYASINAMWSERSGDLAAREKAFYSFNWATYMCRANGVVNTGPWDDHVWFTDGYADYVRHFLAGMAAVPAWAPPGATHLLRSTSVVVEASYQPSQVSYRTFDGDGQEVLRLAFSPAEVWADGLLVPASATPPGTSFSWDPSGGVLRLHRSGARAVQVIGAASP